jgi:methylmalonyl-CoA/ethylmalonyl-CoA epimerase
MLKKIEHIGIAVSNLKESNLLFEALLGTSNYKTEKITSEGVITSFFDVGTHKIELLQATDSNSPIAKFIDKKGEGVHHIAFEVEDIEAELVRLKTVGFELIHETPKIGADNKRIAFLHPKTTNGVLIELCQERSNKE